MLKPISAVHASIAEVSVHFGIVSNEHKAGHICLRLDRAKSRCAAKGIFLLFCISQFSSSSEHCVFGVQ